MLFRNTRPVQSRVPAWHGMALRGLGSACANVSVNEELLVSQSLHRLICSLCLWIAPYRQVMLHIPPRSTQACMRDPGRIQRCRETSGQSLSDAAGFLLALDPTSRQSVPFLMLYDGLVRPAPSVAESSHLFFSFVLSSLFLRTSPAIAPANLLCLRRNRSRLDLIHRPRFRFRQRIAEELGPRRGTLVSHSSYNH